MLSSLGQLAEQRGQEDKALGLYEAGRRMARMHGNRMDEALLLLDLGRMAGRRGEFERTRELLGRADSIGRDSDVPEMWLVAATCRAAFLETSVDRLVMEFDEFESRFSHIGRQELRYWLWRATKLPVHLVEAKRLLDYLVEHAPKEYRESMLNNVRLNREIMAAWAEHGEKGG